MKPLLSNDHLPRFVPLGQADFQRLEHGPDLKGLLQPFKGKGSLETWANQCTALRDDLIGLAQRRVLQQARAYPFSLLDVQLAQQTTGAGTTFLRWRNLDRSSMGVTLWQHLIASAIKSSRSTMHWLAQASRLPLPLKGFKRPFR